LAAGVNDRGAGPSDERERTLHDELLSYLREHPQAMDSLEGIVEWWLPRQRIRVEVERVARALAALTRAGVVEQVLEGERLLYRLRGGPGGGGGGTSKGDSAP
jgi:hypothetical protein